MSTTLQTLPLAELKEHPDNPRKHFDEAALADLVKSVRTHGVLTPLFVRKNGKGYEILAGHRRFRAAQTAGLQEVSVIIRELDDTTALEIMVLDNLQRDDLHPLEEAEGYASLIKNAGYDVDRIAERINRSTKYVYDRIKLRELIPELRDVFLAGEITAGHAIQLARLSPSQQKRVLGKPLQHGAGGGLFVPEIVDDLGLKDKQKRKPISVRELETWINDHVRFDAASVDPMLFPETVGQLAAAAEEELKVIKITHDYRVPDEARDDKERTFGRPSWKRADGEMDGDGIWAKRAPSKTCEHSVMGVVVAGPGRGEAFRVCVAKKCKTHWAAEVREAEKRAKGGGPKRPAAPKYDWKAEQQKRDEKWKHEELERARWKKAAPKLLDELSAKVAEAPAAKMLDIVIGALMDQGVAVGTKHLKRGRTIEDGVRYAAFQVLALPVNDSYSDADEIAKLLKPFGIDAKKIVDQIAPQEKPKKEATTKAEKKKPGARARRRANKVQAAAKA